MGPYPLLVIFTDIEVNTTQCAECTDRVLTDG